MSELLELLETKSKEEVALACVVCSLVGVVYGMWMCFSAPSPGYPMPVPSTTLTPRFILTISSGVGWALIVAGFLGILMGSVTFEQRLTRPFHED